MPENYKKSEGFDITCPVLKFTIQVRRIIGASRVKTQQILTRAEGSHTCTSIPSLPLSLCSSGEDRYQCVSMAEIQGSVMLFTQGLLLHAEQFTIMMRRTVLEPQVGMESFSFASSEHKRSWSNERLICHRDAAELPHEADFFCFS